jgi:CMP/dCMP kinase
MIIAVDGPSASGKGTLARGVAREFGYHYLDTGTLYRMVGLSMLRDFKSEDDVTSATAFARGLKPHIFQDQELRSEVVADMASRVAQIPEVRSALLEFQREFSKKRPGAVLDGRDIGTVICPDANLKFFITARADVRAQRRFRELEKSGVSYDSVMADVVARDARDAHRTLKADDAIVIDTSELSVAEALAEMIKIIRKKR